ncbi:YcxB family protein [Streptomyces sp. NPDC003042]
MDTNTVPAADEAVRLVYRATTADLNDAVRARNSRTPAGRRRRWVYVGIAVPFLALSVLSALGSDGIQPVSVGLAAGALSIPVTALIFPRLQVRAFAELLEKAGEMRAVVDDSGVQLTTADTATRIGWAAQPAYAETDRAFVMLSADKQAVGMTVLPKRGAQAPADVDRLRAILDRNLRRL